MIIILNFLFILLRYWHNTSSLINDIKALASILTGDNCGSSFNIWNNINDDSILEVILISKCFRFDK